jgi:hypothetical protein
MMGARPLRLGLTALLLGVVVLLFGAYIGVLSASRTITNSYHVDIQTRPGLVWTLWIPKASIPMSLSVSGDVRSVAPVETTFGRMENVTGEGYVSMVWNVRRMLDTTGPMWTDKRVHLNLSAWEEKGLHVWRSSSDPNEAINLSVRTPLNGSEFGTDLQCGGSYQGELSEGWNLVPVGFGDCVVSSDGIPWPNVVFPALVLVGTGFIVISVAILLRWSVAH